MLNFTAGLQDMNPRNQSSCILDKFSPSTSCGPGLCQDNLRQVTSVKSEPKKFVVSPANGVNTLPPPPFFPPRRDKSLSTLLLLKRLYLKSYYYFLKKRSVWWTFACGPGLTSSSPVYSVEWGPCTVEPRLFEPLLYLKKFRMTWNLKPILFFVLCPFLK